MTQWVKQLCIRHLLARINALQVQALLKLDKRDRLRATVDWLKGIV